MKASEALSLLFQIAEQDPDVPVQMAIPSELIERPADRNSIISDTRSSSPYSNVTKDMECTYYPSYLFRNIKWHVGDMYHGVNLPMRKAKDRQCHNFSKNREAVRNILSDLESCQTGDSGSWGVLTTKQIVKVMWHIHAQLIPSGPWKARAHALEAPDDILDLLIQCGSSRLGKYIHEACLPHDPAQQLEELFDAILSFMGHKLKILAINEPEDDHPIGLFHRVAQYTLAFQTRGGRKEDRPNYCDLDDIFKTMKELWRPEYEDTPEWWAEEEEIKSRFH